LEDHLKQRCRTMLKEGMIEEAESLLKKGIPADCPAFQALGYKLAIQYIQKTLNRQVLEETFYQQTRQYAKRQMTWFRANPRIHWIEINALKTPAKIAESIRRQVD